MALLDVLIGIAIGVVGGVVVPAAVLYKYRRRIGQWFIERQATQAIEEGFGFDDAVDDAGPDEGGFGRSGMGEGGFGGMGTEEAGFGGPGTGVGGFDEPGTGEADFDGPGTVGTAPGGTDTGEDTSTPEPTITGSGGETRRCDCGELVSPRLDEVCPNCGTPVVVE